MTFQYKDLRKDKCPFCNKEVFIIRCHRMDDFMLDVQRKRMYVRRTATHTEEGFWEDEMVYQAHKDKCKGAKKDFEKKKKEIQNKQKQFLSNHPEHEIS